jgi:ribose transport system substrate-binding protein
MKHSIFRRAICTLLSLLLIFVLFGCSKSENNDTSEEVEYFDFEPITDIKDGQKNVYVVLKVMTGQYWESLAQGVADSGGENDCNVYLGGPAGEGDWETQERMIRAAVDAGADAIMLSPANSTALSSVITEIHDEGIPVILVDTILNDTSIFDTCYMTDNLQAGSLAASEMLRQLKQSGASENEELQVAIQITSVSSQTVIDRLAGFNQYWSANAPSSWTVLDEVKLNNGDKDKAKQNCIDFLNEYPSIKGVFGCNNSSTIGFVNGLVEEKRDDVALVGFDYADETAEFISSHNAATIVQNQYNMGYDGLKQALDMLNGESADYKFIDTGTLEVNKDNQAEYENAKVGESK